MSCQTKITPFEWKLKFEKFNTIEPEQNKKIKQRRRSGIYEVRAYHSNL